MPAASEPGRTSRGVPDLPPLPVRFRPFGVRVAVAVLAVLLLATLVFVFGALPNDVQHEFTFAQWLTFLAMVVAVLGIGYALARCRVDADVAGVTLVNGYRTHRLVWSQVVAVTLRPGNPWAVLDLTDGTVRSAMGIQGSDGARAVRHTRQLRALIEAHAAEDPHDRPEGPALEWPEGPVEPDGPDGPPGPPPVG
ncbi:MAG: hypothetical protein QOK15_3277 [Nocardioidaceae bacterium]|nr:hypothetical protein [Nocardioidaceae bacterium]